MVRAIVGTMIEIGFGKMNLEEFEEIILPGTDAGQENLLRQRDYF